MNKYFTARDKATALLLKSQIVTPIYSHQDWRELAVHFSPLSPPFNHKENSHNDKHYDNQWNNNKHNKREST